MCGIAGILRLHRPDEPIPPHLEAIPEKWLDILDDSIKHRGPDGCGRFRDRAIRPDGTVVDVAFVHRRLSIIDHAGGWQPMVHIRHPDGSGELLKPQRFVPDHIGARPEGIGIIDLTGETTQVPPRLREADDLVAVVFNGCIYNHREVRAELEALGHTFETDHSDTEVLVHGWSAWGLNLQTRLDGMYAIALWDRKTRQIVLMRDLAGEKPLVVSALRTRTDYAFASTISAPFIALPPGEGKSTNLSQWIRNGFAPAAVDPWNEVHPSFAHLYPGWITRHGHVDSMNDDAWIEPHVHSLRHMIIPRPGALPFKDADDVAAEIEHAVATRLEADVPMGIFLSGGLDSALIAAMACTHRPDLPTITLEIPGLDESAAAQQTAATLQLPHHVLQCPMEAAEDLVALIHQLRLPFGDSSLLPTYWICRAARDHITVALAGDGGDELFGGYRRHTAAPVLQNVGFLLKLFPPGLLPRRKPSGRCNQLERLAQAARSGGYASLLSLFQHDDAHALGLPPSLPCNHALSALAHDFESYLPYDLLRKSDTASMAVGLELRAPLLATSLIHRARATPLSVLMPNNERKGLLKQVARKYLPAEIIDRPKQGFAVPIGDWFRNDFGRMRQLLYDHLESTEPFPGLAEAGVIINMDFVRRMLREHDAAGEKSLNPWHGRDHSQRLYMLLVLSIWAKWLDRLRRDENDGSPSV